MTRDTTSSISLFDPTNGYIESTRECLLFPTYAKRDPIDSSQWIVKAKGWALSHNSSTTKQKMMMGITKSVAGKSSMTDRNSTQMFEERFKYFLARNKRHVTFLIQAIGTTTLEESRKVTRHELLQQQQLFQPLMTDSLDMLSTRFVTASPMSYYLGKDIFPDTPPTEEEEDDDDDYEEEEDDDDEEEEDEGNVWYLQEDPHLLSRPSNPVSAVLDTNYFDDMMRERKYSNASSTTTECSREEVVNGVLLRTKGSGFLHGQFLIRHDNILNWAQEQNQCDSRLIRIQSVCTIQNKFSPNHNLVNLVEPTGISIISDIDDTIKDTQVRAGARTVLSKTFFESPKSVRGMADAYMAWYSQGASFHYVSNSPFQLMPMIDNFIRDERFPPGSMHLRDDGKLIARLVETPGQAKREAILDILSDFPHRQFILVGDSGEIDLEIYTRIAMEYPDQILKIFIHDVTTPTISELKQSMTTVRQRSGTSFTSLFYSKRRSQSATDFVVLNQKKKEAQGIRRAVTSMVAEYAIEPHLTGHRSTVHIDDDGSSNPTLLDPLKYHKVSTVEACAQLYHRLDKARSRVAIDIILFQDADILQKDPDIKNALWEMLDSSTADN